MRTGREGWAWELLLFGLAACWFALAELPDSDSSRGFELGPRPEGALRVVTWNLGTGVDAGTTGFQDQYLGSVVQTLERLDADLVFLQELDSRRQLKRLAAALGDEWQFTYARVSGTRALAVMSQRGTLKLEPSRGLERALAVSFRSELGVQLLCVGMHADAFSSRQRNHAIGSASRFLEERGAGYSTLFAGDLNLDLDIDKRRDLFTDDAYLDVETYNFLSQWMRDTGLGHGPSAKPDRRIDYIFVQAGVFRVLAGGPWAGRRQGGMDHEPVVADLLPLAQAP